MIFDDGRVAVRVFAVPAEVNLVRSCVPCARGQVAVLPILVPVVDVVVHALLAVLADAVLFPCSSYELWVHRVHSTRVVLIDEREAGVIERSILFADFAKGYFFSPAVSANSFALVLFQHALTVLCPTLVAGPELLFVAGFARRVCKRFSAVAYHFQSDFSGLDLYGAVEADLFKPRLCLFESHGLQFSKLLSKLVGRDFLPSARAAPFSRMYVHLEGETRRNFYRGGDNVKRALPLTAGAYLVDRVTDDFVFFVVLVHDLVCLQLVHKSRQLVSFGKGVRPLDEKCSPDHFRVYSRTARVLIPPLLCLFLRHHVLFQKQSGERFTVVLEAPGVLHLFWNHVFFTRGETARTNSFDVPPTFVVLKIHGFTNIVDFVKVFFDKLFVVRYIRVGYAFGEKKRSIILPLVRARAGI